MRRLVFCLVLGGLLASPTARADALTDAKNYFKAGASAYTAGDYLAAIQALEAAYRLTPLPAIAFSLAQAERRQYFVSRIPAHLVRAIELYRTYLNQVPTGGRRADATDALAQLEPLALGITTTPSGEPGTLAVVGAAKTRVMVTSEAPGAHIALDGGQPKPTPLIAEVPPGEHTIRVNAEGFFPSERRIVAVAGELVPVEVELRERPAVLILDPSAEAELYIDGSYSGRVRKGTRIELVSGPHQFALVSSGRSVESRAVTLARGETRRIPIELRWTGQRVAAVSLLAVSGVTLASGVLFTAVAVDRERAADGILARRRSESLSPSDLADYEEARESRDRSRAAAIGSYAVSAASLVTGALLFSLDDPNLRGILTRPTIDRVPSESNVRAGIAPVPGGLRVDSLVRF